jgi:hypothetical protein
VRATELGVRRSDDFQIHRSPLYRAFCFNDWMGACAALNANPESEEGRKVLEMLGYHARITEEQGLPIGFWWILPVVEMNDSDKEWYGPAKPEA